MDRLRHHAHLATYAVLLIAVAACGSQAGSTGTDPGSPSLDGDWLLRAASPFALVDTHPITLTVDGDQASGRSACNSYGGSVSATADRVSFGQLTGTEMACIPTRVMDLEQAYLAALQIVDAARRDGDTLTLTGPDVSMTFEPVPSVPTAELTGTAWLLESLVEGDTDDASVSSVAGDPATLLLAEDGTLSGATGCRGLTGTWQVSGAEVVVGSFSADQRSCPKDLERQDSHVVGVLGDGFRAVVTGDVLTVTGRFGTGLVYRLQ